MRSPQILIVDDEADFRTPINAILTHHGMTVMEAATATEMDAVLNRFEADIVLLDVNLPDESGLDIACRLKQTRKIDIVMLSALGDVEDRVSGLSSGADYYLPKPVDIRELLAVIDSRVNRAIEQGKTPQWQLDTTKWLLTTPDGVEHALSRSERNILHALMGNAGKPVTRQQLYTALGMPDYAPESRSLDIHITRIRRRFSTGNYTIPIKTVHCVGYLFSDSADIQ